MFAHFHGFPYAHVHSHTLQIIHSHTSPGAHSHSVSHSCTFTCTPSPSPTAISASHVFKLAHPPTHSRACSFSLLYSHIDITSRCDTHSHQYTRGDLHCPRPAFMLPHTTPAHTIHTVTPDSHNCICALPHGPLLTPQTAT